MTLSALIRQRCAERGWTLSGVARRGDLPVATVHALKRDEHLRQTPRPDTLERLARGLELELEVVQRAAALSVGLVVSEEQLSPELRVIVAGLLELPAERRPELRAVVERELARIRAELAGGVETAPEQGEGQPKPSGPAATG